MSWSEARVFFGLIAALLGLCGAFAIFVIRNR